MRTKLTDRTSIPNVIRDLTLEEKLNLAGEYTACHTMEIKDMDIPSLYLLDGATGVNGAQVLLDFISMMEKQGREDVREQIYQRYMELRSLNVLDLQEARETYREEPAVLEMIDAVERFRPDSKQFISFPSGFTIGAAFDPALAEEIGAAIGMELRSSGVDICMGPNVDIARDPLGGRNYEMYGEDPFLVGQMAAAVTRGIQSSGTAACAKHYLANNQETNRNTKNTHVSERVLRELYARGFISAIRDGNTRAVMTAYNAINGEFTSYSKKLMTDWLRDEFEFDGLLVCDWGAVKEYKEKALDAGMDLILCGPNDMTEVREAIERGEFSEKELGRCVEHILALIVWLRETREKSPLRYEPKEILKICEKMIAEGAVLLKNEKEALPLKEDEPVTFYGRRSKKWMECGTGSTAVVTGLTSNVYEEYKKLRKRTSYETMEEARTLVYTVTAPAGENIDRSVMDIEEEDRKRLPGILRQAKQAGMKTVVLLNVAGPVDMREWIDDADSVLCVFFPGCMGGIAAARLLTGQMLPGGRLPVTFPLRLEDTPSYPNFPGEYNDVYYGEGLFVGYRFYEKRKQKVLFPFGHGLSYTTFVQELLERDFFFDALTEDGFEVPIRVKNTGRMPGSQVIFIFSSEENPHVLRPERELVGFGKVFLLPGEEKILRIWIGKEALRYFDIEKERWVQPVGRHFLTVATSAEQTFDRALLTVAGEKVYQLGPESLMLEVMKNPRAMEVIDRYTNHMMSGDGEEGMAMMAYTTVAECIGSAEFTWWINTDDGKGTYYEKYEENPAIQWLNNQYWDVENGGIGTKENGTNVKFSFQTPIAGAEQDNFNTMLSTDSYPEILDLSYAQSSAETLHSDGVLMEITEYVEKYMPNYQKALEKYPDLKNRAVVTDEDGKEHYYSLPGYGNGQGDAWDGFMYRRDWLVEYAVPTEYVWDWNSDVVKEKGHPAVTPLEEAVAAGNMDGWKKNEVTSFTSSEGADPKNDYTDNVIFPSGKTDPYTISDWEWMFEAFDKALKDKGFSGDGDAYCISTMFYGYIPMGDLVSSFGGGTGTWYIDPEGEVSFSGTSDNFKLYLECMNNWYEKGWFDTKFETRTNDMFFSINETGFTRGMVGMWCGTLATLGDTIRVTCADPEDQQKAYVMGCSLPINDKYGNDEQKFFTPDALYQTDRYVVGIGITTAAEDNENLPALFTCLDYLYNEEELGASYMSYGLSREQYSSLTLDPDLYAENGLTEGAYSWEDGTDGKKVMKLHYDPSSDIANALKATRLGMGLGVMPYPDDGSYTVDSGNAKVVAHALEQFAMYTNTGNITSYTTRFNDDENNTYNSINTKITDYTNQMLPKMIKNGLDDWEKYVEKVESYHPEEVSEIIDGYLN